MGWPLVVGQEYVDRLRVGNGLAAAYIRWTCATLEPRDGPVVDIRVVNADTVGWTCHFANATKPGGRSLTASPGTDATYADAALRSVGLETRLDASGLTITREVA